MKLNIAFDFDCVIVDIYSQTRCYLENDGYKVNDNCEYDMIPSINPEINKEELWKYFIRCYEKYDETPICDGAVELLELLHAKSQEPILFVTTRPSWAAAHTHALIQRFLNVPYMVAFVQERYGKIAYLNNTDYFVEDRRKTAIELAAHGKSIFVPKWSWNEMPENKNIFRINGIKELIGHADQFIK